MSPVTLIKAAFHFAQRLNETFSEPAGIYLVFKVKVCVKRELSAALATFEAMSVLVFFGWFLP